MGLDMDLQSIQEVRDLIRDAKKAQEVFGTFDQQRVDAVSYTHLRAHET